MPDHEYMLVSIPPKISISTFMGYLKGKSALMMFDRHANLKYKRDSAPELAKNSNVSDYATIHELTILSNLETHNAQMIRERKSKEERFAV